jgi:hypothetical protein
MSRIRRTFAIRLQWCVVVGVIVVALITTDDSERRLWLLTGLSWLCFPSSFLIAPLANSLIIKLNVENAKAIDLMVATFMGVGGYLQWFWLLPALSRRFRRT